MHILTNQMKNVLIWTEPIKNTDREERCAAYFCIDYIFKVLLDMTIKLLVLRVKWTAAAWLSKRGYDLLNDKKILAPHIKIQFNAIQSSPRCDHFPFRYKWQQYAISIDDPFPSPFNYILFECFIFVFCVNSIFSMKFGFPWYTQRKTCSFGY